MVERLFDLVASLPDKGFRWAVLIALFGMAGAQYATWRSIDSIAKEKDTAVTLARYEERIQSLERQVQALWRRGK